MGTFNGPQSAFQITHLFSRLNFLLSKQSAERITAIRNHIMANDLEHQLRQAIRDWGGSLYNLAAISGVPYSQIHRFMSEERSLTLPVAGRLAAALGLELRPAKRSTRNK